MVVLRIEKELRKQKLTMDTEILGIIELQLKDDPLLKVLGKKS